MNTKLYVGGLSENTSEDQLRELFSQAGHVQSFTRSLERQTKRLRNFAFIEMGTVEEAAKAIQLFNGYEIDGHAIKVSEARSEEKIISRGGFDHSGGRHGHDQFIRGNTRSGTGRRSGRG